MAWLAAVYLKHLCGFYLTRGYLSANSIVNRPCPNRRFILCHRAADQSNRIKNNEIARISLTKKIYIYISPHLHFVNLRQPVHRVSRLLFSFFPPCSFGSSWMTKLVDQFRESNLMEKKKRERAPLAPMWDTQRELSINLCIKKLIFTLYETSTSNPFPRRNREDSENKNKERKERRKAKKKKKERG